MMQLLPTAREVALGASISRFPVTNCHFNFISLLCSFPELHQCNQGYGIWAGFLSLLCISLTSPLGAT